MPNEPQTLLEAVRHFSDLDLCNEHMIAVKWPDGAITCPKCGGKEIGRIASRRKLQCKAVACRKQFSAKVGTIFDVSVLVDAEFLQRSLPTGPTMIDGRTVSALSVEVGHKNQTIRPE